MKNREVFEVVLLRLKAGTNIEAFRAAAKKTQAFLKAQPGYLERRLLYFEASGQWMDYVRWSSREDAEEAAKKFPSAPENVDFMQILDPTDMVMHHFEELSLA